MAKSELRIRAHALRKSGMSIRSIADTLSVSRASASVWCRDVTLTKRQKATLMAAQIRAGHKGRLIGAEMNRRKKAENMSKQESIARELIGGLTKRDMLLLGIALYWGEGVKAQGSTAAIVNSDPATILFARDWFEALGLTRDRFRPSILISEIHRNREGRIINFWSKLLGIPRSQFAKVVFLKGRPKKIYENNDSYYGVLALRIRRGSDMKYRILSLIRICKEQAGVAQWQ